LSGDSLSISATDRYRNNQREFLQHACFLERIAIHRSIVIHSDGLLFTERGRESPFSANHPLCLIVAIPLLAKK